MSNPRDPQERLDVDPPRDPELAEALRRFDSAYGRFASGNAEQHDALRNTIVSAARPRLSDLARGGDAWWQWTARWGSAAIPIGLAAGIIGVTLASLLSLPVSDDATPRRAPIVAFDAVASSAHSGRQLIDSLVGPATDAWLLGVAVEQ